MIQWDELLKTVRQLEAECDQLKKELKAVKQELGEMTVLLYLEEQKRQDAVIIAKMNDIDRLRAERKAIETGKDKT